MSDESFKKEVGRRLKMRREELGYKQSELVEIFNKYYSDSDGDFLSDKQISRVESGKSNTKIHKFVKWSFALGKTPDYFLLGIDTLDNDSSDIIEQICRYLRLCSKEDVENTLLFVKAMYDKNNK